MGLEVNNEVRFYYIVIHTANFSISSEHIDYAWLAYDQAKKLLTFYQSTLILEKCIAPKVLSVLTISFWYYCMMSQQ